MPDEITDEYAIELGYTLQRKSLKYIFIGAVLLFAIGLSGPGLVNAGIHPLIVIAGLLVCGLTATFGIVAHFIGKPTVSTALHELGNSVE